MFKYFILFLISSILTAALLAILRKISLKSNLFISKEGVPYIGGPAIFLSLVFSYLAFFSFAGIKLPPEIVTIFIFFFILAAIEFIDDMKDFSLRMKVIMQIIFIFFFLLYAKRVQIHFLPSWANYLISFLWIMGITNAFNLLDISDGLCAGVALTISLAFMAVSFIKADFVLFGLFTVLSGTLLSFMIFNFPPAKVFMGNSGSHLLGFLFASLSIYGDYAALDNKIALLTPLLILFFPIIDTFILIIMRLKRGIIPLKKSNDHIFLYLLKAGYTHKKSLAKVCFVNLLWVISGVAVVFGINPIFIIFIILAALYTLRVILNARLQSPIS